MSEKTERVYVTKWALTKGVLVAVCRITEGWYASNTGIRGPGDPYIFTREWRSTEVAAGHDVLEKIACKLKALDRQRARLEALRQAVKAAQPPAGDGTGGGR